MTITLSTAQAIESTLLEIAMAGGLSGDLRRILHKFAMTIATVERQAIVELLERDGCVQDIRMRR